MRWAHLLLAVPEHWTRHVWARDQGGQEVDFASATAVCWCAGGAILAANNELYAGRGVIEIPVDRLSNEATLVQRPRRVVAALEALGVGFMHTSAERLRPSPLTLEARSVRELGFDKQHPTLLAADINDLPQIKHAHVALALAWTMSALQDEIDRRSTPKATTTASTRRQK